MTENEPGEPVVVVERPARRTNVRGQARRRQILDVAVELFTQQGARRTGIVEVANRAGISHVGVLHHFGSKEGLLRAVVEDQDDHQNAVWAALPPMRGEVALRRLLSMGRSEAVRDPRGLLMIELMAENLHEEDALNEYFRDRYARARGYVADAIRTGQEDGEFRADLDPEAIAQQCVSLVLGNALQVRVDPTMSADDAGYLATVDLLMFALRGGAAPSGTGD